MKEKKDSVLLLENYDYQGLYEGLNIEAGHDYVTIDTYHT